MPRETHEDCLREDDFKRLEVLIEKSFTRMDAFLTELRNIMVEDARRSEKLIQVEKELGLLYKKHRELAGEVRLLTDWRQQYSGSLKTLMAIPTVCALLSTLLSMYFALKP